MFGAQRRSLPVGRDRLALPADRLQCIAEPDPGRRALGIEHSRAAVGGDGFLVASQTRKDVGVVKLHECGGRIHGGCPYDARTRTLEVEPLELGPREIDPCGEVVGCGLDRAFQELFGLSVVLALHRDLREQPERLDVLRVALQDLAVHTLGVFELAGAVQCRGLREPLAHRIGAQEGLHEPFGFVHLPGLVEDLDERELRGLQLRVQLERALQAGNRFVGAGLLQQAPAQLLVALRIPRFRGERQPEQGLRFLAAILAIERGAEER